MLARQFLESLPEFSSLFKPGHSTPLYTISSYLGPGLFNPGYPKEPKSFGEWLRKFRLDQGLLIKDFARLVGVSEDTIINWEKRNVKPRGRAREKLMEYLKGKLGKNPIGF